ncbi:MAG: hypothetical protein QM796_04315 [Chthoniobacteraceae bacterium]
MPRKILFILCIFLAFTGLFGSAAYTFSHLVPTHLWTERLNEPLPDGTRLQIENVIVFQQAPYSILRVKCHWLGHDPAERYDVRAELHASADGPALDPEHAWTVNEIPDPANGDTVPFSWDFTNPPKDTKRFYLRVYFHPPDSLVEKEFARFDLPTEPNLIQ